MTSHVLDASVAAKWYVSAQGEKAVLQATELARQFATGNIRLFAPDLICSELGNVLWKAVRFRSVSIGAAHDSIQASPASVNALFTTPSMWPQQLLSIFRS